MMVEEESHPAPLKKVPALASGANWLSSSRSEVPEGTDYIRKMGLVLIN